MIHVLVVTRGHAFAHDAFLAMLDAIEGIDATLVQHPAAQAVLAAPDADRWDAVLFYDMCGIPGLGDFDDADVEGRPSQAYADAIEALLARGTGLVLLNHACVQWPNWPRWREISGSSFMLTEGELWGETVPGSGYRGAHGPLPNATVQLTRQAPHPVLADIVDGFEVTDELYLKSASFEERVRPLLRANYDFVVDNFSPPPLAPPEQQASWDHPPGSNLVAWANACGHSPIVASDLGDGPDTYGNPGFQRFLTNALEWVSSDGARTWAAGFGS